MAKPSAVEPSIAASEASSSTASRGPIPNPPWPTGTGARWRPAATIAAGAAGS